jgi:hypothetical protein
MARQRRAAKSPSCCDKMRMRNHTDTSILSKSPVRSRRVNYTEELVTVNKCWAYLSPEITKLSRTEHPLILRRKLAKTRRNARALLQNYHTYSGCDFPLTEAFEVRTTV